MWGNIDFSWVVLNYGVIRSVLWGGVKGRGFYRVDVEVK